MEVTELQDMVRRIVEADAEAKALEEANRKSAEKERQKIEEQAEAIYQQYMDDAEKEIERNNAYLEKRSEKKLADILARQESALIKLKSDYEQNRDHWVEEIYNRVVV